MIELSGPHRVSHPRSAARLWLLLLALMTLLLGLLAALVFADVQRRAAESLDDFGWEQERLARGLALGLRARDPESLLPGLRDLDHPGVVRLLLRPPRGEVLLGADGGLAPLGPLREAMDAGLGHVLLPRAAAEALGLPRRSVMVGLAPFQAAFGERWWVAVAASARRERDREIQASWRSLLAVLVAAGAVLLLGAVAVSLQRRALQAQQALALEEAHSRREEELARASRAATLGTLAMGITHELSTPLSIIAARAEQLCEGSGTAEGTRRGARIIGEQAERMGQIIRGLLGLVRGEAPAAQDLRPALVARGAVALVQHRFAAAGVRIQMKLIEPLPLVRGDQRLLEHALVNLLLNACDACGSGGQVELRTWESAEQVVFTVTDNGATISAEAARRALEPFFTTKPPGQGTGLGLAIAHEIIKSHRGALSLGPLAAGGTQAEIRIPAMEHPHGP